MVLVRGIMAFKFSLIVVGLGVIGLTDFAGIAQIPSNKADAIAALNEYTYDKNRFERAAAMAKSLGVSDQRITLSRFFFTLVNGDLDGVKRALPEFEKALGTLPAEEADSSVSEFRNTIPKFKKVLESGDANRLKTSLENYRREYEAKAILGDLRRIDTAVDIYAIQQRLKIGDTVPVMEWIKHIKAGTALRDTGTDIFGVAYGNQIVDKAPKPNPASLEKVSKYVPADFFDLTSPTNRR